MSKKEEKQTLLDWFHHWELTQPQAIYLTQPDKGGVTDYTWAEVSNQARRMAAHLKTLKLASGSSIGILSKNCAHWIMADLAIWMAGHVSVPLYTTLNAETGRYIVDHARIKLLFVGKLDEQDWATLQEGLPDTLPLLALPLGADSNMPQWHDIVSQTQPIKVAVRRKPSQLATIIYTSGSTGNPKGVKISFDAMLSSAQGLAQLLQITNRDRMLSYLPLAHTAERAAVEASSLRHGFRVYFAESLPTFAEDLKRARPTLFFSVPRLWTKFYQGIQQKLPTARQKLLFRTPVIGGIVKRKLLQELGLDHTRIAMTGAAPLAPAIVNWYRELGLELLEVYGMSENFAYSHVSRPGQVRVGTVGQPAPGVQCRIAADGEILVKSPCTMMGYHRSKSQTDKAIDAKGWLHTGDRGVIDDKGRLQITGRVKDLFKTSKGKYVAPAPIENQLTHHVAIEAACVSGSGRPQPYALAVLSEAAREQLTSDDRGRAVLERELANMLDDINSDLEPQEVLDFLVVVKAPWDIANGFLTPTMKIKRNVVEAHYAAQVDGWASRRRKIVWD